MLSDYFRLAFKNVRKRGIRSWLTMLGVFIGIAAVVSLISLGQGLETAINGQFGASVSTDVLTVSSSETGFGPPGAFAVRKLNEHDLKIIESVAGVQEAIPRIIRIAKVEFNNEVGFEFVGSLPEKQEQTDIIYKQFNFKIDQGKLLESSDREKVVLGNDFLSEDRYGKKIFVGDTINIQGKDFEVKGFLKRASTFILNSAILMPEEDEKEILNIKDEIDLIAVKIEPSADITKVAEEIERKLRNDRDQDPGEEDFEVQTPIQSLESVNTVLNIINLVVLGIALVSLFVGGIGIANTMFTSVLERTKEIGVMKAIGARNKDILSIFIIEAGILGLVGGIVGALIGLGLSFTVSAFANSSLGENILQVSLSLPLLLGSIGFSLFIGILSGIIPAYQASKLNPVEALRK